MKRIAALCIIWILAMSSAMSVLADPAPQSYSDVTDPTLSDTADPLTDPDTDDPDASGDESGAESAPESSEGSDPADDPDADPEGGSSDGSEPVDPSSSDTDPSEDAEPSSEEEQSGPEDLSPEPEEDPSVIADQPEVTEETADPKEEGPVEKAGKKDEKKTEKPKVVTEKEEELIGAPSVKTVSPDPNAVYEICSAVNKRFVLDVKRGSKEPKANIQLYSSNDTLAQKWRFQKNSDNTWTILAVASDLAVDVQGARDEDRTNIRQYTSNGTKAQKWILKDNGDGTVTFLWYRNQKRVLDVAGGRAANGSNVRLYKSNGTKAQRFVLKKTKLPQPNLNGTYIIRSALHTDRVLDVQGGSKNNKANIQTYDNNWSDAQLFKLTQVKGDIYTITNSRTKKALDVAGGQFVNGTNIRQYTPNKTRSQQWKITQNADGTYTIASAGNTGLVLDISGNTDKPGANVQLYQKTGRADQKWHLTQNRISTCTTSASNVKVTGVSSGRVGDDRKIYLFAVDPLDQTLKGYKPVASVSSGKAFTVSAALKKNTSASLLQKKFYTAIKYKGVYTITSNGMYLTNPEKASSNSTKRITGKNKKGISLSGRSSSYAFDLGASHVAINFPLSMMLEGSGYSYTYNGTTYRFGSAVAGYVQQVKELNRKGIEVTGVFYLDTRSGMDKTYITPNGRGAVSAGAPIAAMNVQEKTPRRKIEALFSCLATIYSKSDCQIGNWVIGNEINTPSVWNYSGGGLTRHQYSQMCADVYRVANTAIKSTWGKARVFLSLDHVWTYDRGSGYFKARDILFDVHTILTGEGALNWDLAFHPYCSPEQDPRIWNKRDAVKNGSIITPVNLEVLTNYVSSLSGSHRIILSETGISARVSGRGNYEREQAAAIAYAYYLATNNKKIDNLIIHQLCDDAGENAGGWYLGLIETNGRRRRSYEVFKRMSTKNYLEICDIVGDINGRTTWKELIPGFNIRNYL